MKTKLLKIASKRWPLKTLALSLSPNEIALAKYEINSITASNGTKMRGQPLGTKKLKNSHWWVESPTIVTPNQIVILNETMNTMWELRAKK